MTDEMRKLLAVFDRTVLDNWNRDGAWTCVEDVRPTLFFACDSLDLVSEAIKLAYKTRLYEGAFVIEEVPGWVRPREEK